jgi:DNA-nicking Smr family endonuclease
LRIDFFPNISYNKKSRACCPAERNGSMRVEKGKDVVKVDLHGLTVADAKYRLEHFLSNLPAGVKEVYVIHGCNHGQALRDMVRYKLKHPRIASKLLTLNPGETRLIIKQAGIRQTKK